MADFSKYVSDWFLRADDDLALINVGLKEKTSPNLICFHAEQAVEKCLKGFIAHHDKHIRKLHDLEIILEDCTDIDPSFQDIREETSFLNQFYTKSRYPDDYIELSREDAEKAYAFALHIKNFVQKKMQLQKEAGSILVFAILAVAVILIGGYFLYQKNVFSPFLGEICSQELKSCPDGTMVGRTGPNCEFAKCPGENTRSSAQDFEKNTEKTAVDTSNWKTYRNEKFGSFEFKYPPSWQEGASKRGGLYLDGRQEGHIEILPKGDDLNFSDRPANLSPSELEKYKMNLDQFMEVAKHNDAFQNIRKTQLNSYNAYEIDFRTMAGEYGKPETFHEEIAFAVFVENEKGYVYQIMFEGRSNKDALTDQEKQILSTFKFIR